MSTEGSGGDPSAKPLPSGSVVPGADIWDDDDDWVGTGSVVDLDLQRQIHQSRLDTGADTNGADEAHGDEPVQDSARADEEWDDEAWMTDAQIVAHADDEGVHDGSRGVEADDDETTEALGTKMQRWGSTSMLGASLSGLGMGLQKILKPRESTQIEIQVDDESGDRLDPVEVKLGEDPDHSIAVLRPWLRDPAGPIGGPNGEPGE